MSRSVDHHVLGRSTEYRVGGAQPVVQANGGAALPAEQSNGGGTELEHDPAKIGEILQRALRRTAYFDGELPDGYVRT